MASDKTPNRTNWSSKHMVMSVLLTEVAITSLLLVSSGNKFHWERRRVDSSQSKVFCSAKHITRHGCMMNTALPSSRPDDFQMVCGFHADIPRDSKTP